MTSEDSLELVPGGPIRKKTFGLSVFDTLLFTNTNEIRQSKTPLTDGYVTRIDDVVDLNKWFSCLIRKNFFPQLHRTKDPNVNCKLHSMTVTEVTGVVVGENGWIIRECLGIYECMCEVRLVANERKTIPPTRQTPKDSPIHPSYRYTRRCSLYGQIHMSLCRSGLMYTHTCVHVLTSEFPLGLVGVSSVPYSKK